MCGIVGAFKPGTIGSGPDIVARMRDRMAHRGPDGHGIWCARDQSCTFGHRRLSIIDLSTDANQPMVNDAGTVALIFNGEIYNHADIRRELEALGKYRWRTDHSDTEMLLHAYEEWGLDCVNRFYGMFALAVYDSRDPGRPVVHLVRDRVGIKPLYVTKTRAGEWLFASEIRALLAHPEITPELDRTAFWHYLTFIVSPAPLKRVARGNVSATGPGRSRERPLSHTIAVAASNVTALVGTRPERGPQLLVDGRLDRSANVLVAQFAERDGLTLLRPRLP